MIQMPTLLLKYFSYVCHTNRAAKMTLTSLMLFRTTKKTTFNIVSKDFIKNYLFLLKSVVKNGYAVYQG